MKKALWGLDHVKAFRDKYLAAVMMVAALLISSLASAQVDTTKVRQRINAFGYEYKNITVDSSLRIPRDTFRLKQSDTGSLAFKGGKIWKWVQTDILKWQEAGASVLASQGLSLDGDTVQLGGTLNENAVINLNGKNLDLSGSGHIGNLRVGELTGSTSVAKIQSNTGSAFIDTPYLALGPFLSNSTYATIHTSDTIVTSNVNTFMGRGFQLNRNIVMSDNNLTISDRAASSINLLFRLRDTVRLNPVGSDLLYANRNALIFAKAGGFTGRSRVQSGLFDFDISTANLSIMSLSGGSGSNNFRLRGFYSGNTSYLFASNATDTIDNWVGYWSTGFDNAKVLKAYHYAGGSIGGADSTWNLYFYDANNFNYLNGNTGLGIRVPDSRLHVVGRSHFTDTARLDARFSYNTNIGGSFTIHSLVDKNYVDSAIAAGGGGGGVTDHGALTGLGDDDHTQYALLAGRGTNQVLNGGTSSGDTLTLSSTSNATKGPVITFGNIVPGTDNTYSLGLTGTRFTNLFANAANINGDITINTFRGLHMPSGLADDGSSIGSGSGSLNALTTGLRNVGLGKNTLNLTTTGFDNTAIGSGALDVLGTTGNSNTAIGANAGGGLSGNHNSNIFVGKSAGVSQTAGSSNIAIGVSAGLPSTTASNQLSIGNMIYATGVDGTSTTISSGSVGIKEKAPTEALHVGGRVRVSTIDDASTVDSFVVDNNGVLEKASITQMKTALGVSLTVDTISWVPSFTGVTNFSSATLFKASAIRKGNYVDCDIIVGFDLTSGTTETEIEASLPVASNFTAAPTLSFECRGQMQCYGVSNATRKVGTVIGNPTTDRAVFNFECNSNTGVNDNVFHIWFRYEVK